MLPTAHQPKLAVQKDTGNRWVDLGAVAIRVHQLLQGMVREEVQRVFRTVSTGTTGMIAGVVGVGALHDQDAVLEVAATMMRCTPSRLVDTPHVIFSRRFTSQV